MQSAKYYREQADRALRLAKDTTEDALHDMLAQLARDYADIAEDLELGAVEIRHPELLPQIKHWGPHRKTGSS